MCWNTYSVTGDVGGNTVGVGGNFYNHSIAVPPISTSGTALFVTGGLCCIGFVGCFTTCFKGRTKHQPLTMSEQRAQWQARRKKAAAEGQVVSKLELEIASMAQEEMGVKMVARSAQAVSKVRVLPTVGEPAVDHLHLSMKSKHGLMRLHKKRGMDRTGDLPPHRPPPVEQEEGGANGGDDAGLSADEVWELKDAEEELDPDVAAFAEEAREWAAARRKRFSLCEVF